MIMCMEKIRFVLIFCFKNIKLMLLSDLNGLTLVLNARKILFLSPTHILTLV